MDVLDVHRMGRGRSVGGPDDVGPDGVDHRVVVVVVRREGCAVVGRARVRVDLVLYVGLGRSEAPSRRLARLVSTTHRTAEYLTNSAFGQGPRPEDAPLAQCAPPGPMSALLAIALVLGLIVLLAFAAVALIRTVQAVDELSDEVCFTTTTDGVRIALTRWRPRGDRRHALPVLVVPGLASSRLSFLSDPPRSLPVDLSHHGWDVFCFEPRGKGRSDHPPPALGGFSFDTVVTLDLAAAIDAVLRETGRDRVHLVGHSMGGLLTYTWLSTRPEPHVSAAVVLGSSLDYSGTPSAFAPFARVAWIARGLGVVPLGFFAALLSPLALRWGATVLDRFSVWPPDVDPKVYRRLLAIAFESASGPLLVQLASAFGPGGLRSADGRVRYMEGLAEVAVPVLAFAGTRDAQCAVDAAARTLHAVGADGSELRVLGRANGQAEEYGHFDMVMGRNAPSEVFETVRAFLSRHEG